MCFKVEGSDDESEKSPKRAKLQCLLTKVSIEICNIVMRSVIIRMFMIVYYYIPSSLLKKINYLHILYKLPQNVMFLHNMAEKRKKMRSKNVTF